MSKFQEAFDKFGNPREKIKLPPNRFAKAWDDYESKRKPKKKKKYDR